MRPPQLPTPGGDPWPPSLERKFKTPSDVHLVVYLLRVFDFRVAFHHCSFSGI